MGNQDTNGEEQMIEVEEVCAVTPQNQAMVDAGKKLIGQSLAVGRDYCRFMITTNLSAIPIFLSLVAFAIPDQAVVEPSNRIALLIPVILFLAGSLIFTWGYFPVMDRFSLNIVEEIESVRDKTIRKRYQLIRIGGVLFLFAVLTASFLFISMI